MCWGQYTKIKFHSEIQNILKINDTLKIYYDENQLDPQLTTWINDSMCFNWKGYQMSSINCRFFTRRCSSTFLWRFLKTCADCIRNYPTNHHKMINQFLSEKVMIQPKTCDSVLQFVVFSWVEHLLIPVLLLMRSSKDTHTWGCI